MAKKWLKSVQDYYYEVLNQYLEMKNDIKDYQQAFEDGHFTEDQLESVMQEIKEVEENYNRVAYIIYLLEQPHRDNKIAKYRNSNKKVEQYFKDNKADKESVINENKSLIENIRKELKELTKEIPISTNASLEDLLKDEEEK